ncbi:MAG: ABC transporter permease [Limimaricola sp.]|uniref:ABC transporter permease n=1 Tax=Limimaricola sp. TaxID=2211665 RepID=UPI001DCAC7CB|nr:ABC transporter permease [Limimaricola sp.]MBI1417160.1 ABC transporter permease [Limimaricola sp.]
MFQTPARRSQLSQILSIGDLIYHSIVHNVRKSHKNALIGLLLNILQTIIFVAAFYMMYQIFGIRRVQIRGDFMVYLFTGVFLFMAHAKAIGAVVRADGPTSSMMKHGPLNTLVTISASALSTLYLQIVSLVTVLFLYNLIFHTVQIDDPIGAFGCLLLAWFSGVAVGVIFLSIKPWWPTFAGIASTVYSRANMVGSGKMFVANTLSPKMLAIFSWNPLFHTIDQARGFVFINYNPHNSSFMYPFYVSMALLVIGMMAEFFTRKNASVSWDAGR